MTDNYDINFGYVENKFNFSATLGFNKVKNVFNSIRTLIDSGKTLITYKNISDKNEFQASFWTGITLSQNFRVNMSSGYNYNQYSDIEKKLYLYQDGGSFYATVNYSFSPDKLTVFEGNGRYNSYANPQGKTHSNINMTLAVQHKFLNKKLVVSLAAIDPFGLMKYTDHTIAPNFISDSFSESNSQNFRISINYQINKIFIKTSMSDKQKNDAVNNSGKKNS
jgi:hypothetical protein